VIQLLAEGKTNTEIAIALKISESTVKFHTHGLVVKLGVSDRVQVILTALRRGITYL
jgi:two-component system, NarL family, response regulator